MELARWWPLADHADLRDRLVAAYGDPARGYHDLQHLTEVLTRLDELAEAGCAYERVPVLLAAWFHDAVYRGAPDDEERSARLAATELAGADLAADLVAEVVRLVLVTSDHRPDEADANGGALSDADLGILAAPPERYAEYLATVRREYAHVPEAGFRVGRREILQALADKPTLFHTPGARERWESRARENLTRELSDLAEG